ncbi:MAG: 16S rRNA (uracil(1498)-N(3))-methyltransferase [Lachnospiraceae bacterium]|nr:16S rRNA (uracil(1498)-N(3))-methyltransferase [Lachnospiraceae bacterium]
MPRFFVDPEAVSGERIIVTEGDCNHIRNVLRMRVGDRLTVCDGQGTDYNCEIASFSDTDCVLTIVERTDSRVELPIRITLYQGLPKRDKLEFIVQKAVELGAVRIVPTVCERTIGRLDDAKREQRKTERLRAIAESAAKQSGRGILPEIFAPMTYAAAIREAKESGACVLLPYENAIGMKPTKEAIDEAVAKGDIAVFIGPEGGFSRAEVAAAEEAGARIISLGRRILRTETAGLTVLSALMLEAEIRGESE